MNTKTIIAAAAAALVSAGIMAASTGAAEAHYAGGYYSTQVVSVPKVVYKTLYRTVITGYDDCYNPIYAQVPYTVSETIYVTEYEKVFVPYATDNSYSYNSYGDAPSYGY
jgi:hypothetical protein